MDESFTRNLMSIVQNMGAGGAIFFTCVNEEDEINEFVATTVCKNNGYKCDTADEN